MRLIKNALIKYNKPKMAIAAKFVRYLGKLYVCAAEKILIKQNTVFIEKLMKCSEPGRLPFDSVLVAPYEIRCMKFIYLRPTWYRKFKISHKIGKIKPYRFRYVV